MSSPNRSSFKSSLYDRLGGEPAVALLVDQFYDRVLKDPELEPYFRHIPMRKLREMQREFFAAALDGPVDYSGRPIDQVHKGRGITSRHLSRFMQHLLATIENVHPNEQETLDMYRRIGLYGAGVLDEPSDGSE
jgi:hemoglobin